MRSRQFVCPDCVKLDVLFLLLPLYIVYCSYLFLKENGTEIVNTVVLRTHCYENRENILVDDIQTTLRLFATKDSIHTDFVLSLILLCFKYLLHGKKMCK